MTELRRRLIADLHLRNYSPRTVEAYVGHVAAAFARHFGRAPDSLGPDEVQAYQQHLAQERRVAWSTFHQAMAGLRFFYRVTLGREENLPHLFFAKQPRRLPNVLTRADVAALLDAVDAPTPRLVLRTLYSAGLRLREGTQRKVSDIDSTRMVLRIRSGKGNRERRTPLSPRLLEEFREHYRRCRPTEWLFPGQRPDRPLTDSSVQKAFRRAAELAGLTRRASPHTLRHSYATHQLEAGVDLRTIQQLLGHPGPLYELLFQAASATLREVAADPRRLGGRIGVLAVLHTWGQNLHLHPHLHCVVTGGGLSADGRSWRAARPRYLFPVKVLSALFRGKFLAGLRALRARGELPLTGELAKWERPERFETWLRGLYRRAWVVYAKPPFGGPEQVLKYLARYTHRVAISNGRILNVSDGHVTFSWKDYADGHQVKRLRLTGGEFLRRFLQHVLPRGFVRIRYYGLSIGCFVLPPAAPPR